MKGFIEPHHEYRVRLSLVLDTDSVVAQEHANDCDVTVIPLVISAPASFPQGAGRVLLRMCPLCVVRTILVFSLLLLLLKKLLLLLRARRLTRSRRSRILRLLPSLLFRNLRFRLLSFLPCVWASSEALFFVCQYFRAWVLLFVARVIVFLALSRFYFITLRGGAKYFTVSGKCLLSLPFSVTVDGL